MDAKEKIGEQIDLTREELIALSRELHEEPEIAFEEVQSAKKIVNVLASHGFTVEVGIGGLETAFRAEYAASRKGPVVAFIAEYDALPEIGHGCGHNLIAAMSTGAAIALSKVSAEFQGKVVVMGTPAEEGGGGKITMIRNRCFEDIGYALMIHPATENLICRGGLATRKVTISYQGKAAHSSTPEEGINALQAVIQTFNAIDHLRPMMPLKANVNGIILEGGKVPNVIPDYAVCSFSVRADTVSDLKMIIELIENAVKSVELMTGAQALIEKTSIYTERYPNRIVAEQLKENIATLGERMEYPDPKMKVGSSDIGNLSLVVPAIHSYLKVAEPGTNAHSADFAKASVSDFAHEQMIKGAKALAMTGLDILLDKELRSQIQEEFNIRVPRYTIEELQ